MTHATGLPPASTSFRPVTGEPLLLGINPDLKLGKPSEPLLLKGINPELSGADWKNFQGAPAPTVGKDGTVYQPGPSYGDVKSGQAELSRGHSGAGVSQLQAGLRRSGEKLDVDGLYGPKTEEAVKSFQKKQGLPETGVVDSATAKALDAAAPAPKPAPQPAPRPDNGGGGGGGGGGGVKPPAPPVPPNVPKLSDNPYTRMAQVYDLATNNLQNYQKGKNPMFDAAVQKMLDAPPHLILTGEDPEYGKMLESESRFRQAAKTAGF